MLLQQLVNGLTLGAVYALIGLALSLVMGLLGILNLAIAALFMIGGYLGLSAAIAGAPLPVAFLVAALGPAGLALAIEAVGYQPLRNAPAIMPMLSTLGCSIVLESTATNIWGSDPLQFHSDVMDRRLGLFGLASIGVAQVIVIVTTIVLVAAMGLTVQRTWLGRGLRAVAENRTVARLLGVRERRMTGMAFAMSGALAGAAGFLICIHYAAITPYIGVETGLKALAAMVLGGVANVWGVLIAGPIIGVAEVLTVVYGGSAFRDFVVYGLMILMLLVRPQGLLGGRSASGGQRV
jgi:branched-chain amino acid transport system permease protein